MRRHRVRLTFALLRGVVVGVLFVFAVIALSGEAHCRDIVKFTEEAGDPDMPDRASGGVSDRLGGVMFIPGGSATLLVERGATAYFCPPDESDSFLNQTPRERPTIGHLRLLLWLRSSVAPWVFAF